MTCFELALECSNLKSALESAKTLNQAQVWAKLASEALLQGDHEVFSEWWLPRILAPFMHPLLLPDCNCVLHSYTRLCQALLPLPYHRTTGEAGTGDTDHKEY